MFLLRISSYTTCCATQMHLAGCVVPVVISCTTGPLPGARTSFLLGEHFPNSRRVAALGGAVGAGVGSSPGAGPFKTVRWETSNDGRGASLSHAPGI